MIEYKMTKHIYVFDITSNVIDLKNEFYTAYSSDVQ